MPLDQPDGVDPRKQCGLPRPTLGEPRHTEARIDCFEQGMAVPANGVAQQRCPYQRLYKRHRRRGKRIVVTCTGQPYSIDKDKDNRHAGTLSSCMPMGGLYGMAMMNSNVRFIDNSWQKLYTVMISYATRLASDFDAGFFVYSRKAGVVAHR